MTSPQTDDNEFDLNQYLSSNQDAVAENEAPAITPNNTEEIGEFEKPFNLANYEHVPEESRKQGFVRGAVRTTSRALETILGFPGDFSHLVLETGEYLNPGQNEGLSDKFAKAVAYVLPTSNDLKQVASWLTGGYTDPQGEYEEFGDDVVGLAAALALPVKNPLKFSNLAQSVGKAVLAKSGGKIAEMFGASPGQKAATEVGLLMMTGLAGKGNVNKAISKKYEEARALMPKKIVPTSDLDNRLGSLQGVINKGIPTPSKDQANNIINNIRAKASGGGMDTTELVQVYHDINEIKNSKGLFDTLSKTEKKLLDRFTNLIKDNVDKDIAAATGKTSEAYTTWKAANQANAVFEQSKKVQYWLNSKVSNIPQKVLLGSAFELFTGFLAGEPLKGLWAAGATVGTAAVGQGMVKSGEIFVRVMNDPTLRAHYINAVTAGMKENLPAFVKEMEALQKALDKDEKVNPINYKNPGNTSSNQ